MISEKILVLVSTKRIFLSKHDGKTERETTSLYREAASACFFTKFPRVGLKSFGYQEQSAKIFRRCAAIS